MKPLHLAVIVLATVAGFALADQLDDSYAALQEAQKSNKDPDTIKKLAVDTAKAAKAEQAKAQPADVPADQWQKRVQMAKEVQTFAEYSLATSASAAAASSPAKTIDLVDTLIEINPKSQYLGTAAASYLEALGKGGGSKKQLEGAQKILNGDPNNAYALYYLARSGNATYANRLITVLRGKAPEGMPEAAKNMMLGSAYYVVGASACDHSTWTDCDRDMRQALPLLGGKDGATLFYLGLANYNLGKTIGDRAKMQEGLKYTEQAAAIPGPAQQKAAQNVVGMRQELGGRR